MSVSVMRVHMQETRRLRGKLSVDVISPWAFIKQTTINVCMEILLAGQYLIVSFRHLPTYFRCFLVCTYQRQLHSPIVIHLKKTKAVTHVSRVVGDTILFKHARIYAVCRHLFQCVWLLPQTHRFFH